MTGGGPRVVVSTAAFHARVRGSVPGLGGLRETKMFLSHPRVKLSIVDSLRDREVACSASDRQGLNFESCVWRTVSSHSSHHSQEVLLAQFSLYVHKGGLKPDSFHFISLSDRLCLFLTIGQKSTQSLRQLYFFIFISQFFHFYFTIFNFTIWLISIFLCVSVTPCGHRHRAAAGRRGRASSRAHPRARVCPWSPRCGGWRRPRRAGPSTTTPRRPTSPTPPCPPRPTPSSSSSRASRATICRSNRSTATPTWATGSRLPTESKTALHQYLRCSYLAFMWHLYDPI